MLSANQLVLVEARPFTLKQTARALRQHFARHNRRVIFLALATLVAALALWLILYLVCCWLILLALAVVDAAHPQVPRGFGIVFTVAALSAMLYAWVDRRLTPNEIPRDDKRLGEILADFALMIPRMTLAVGGTLAASQRLTTAELRQAAALVHRLVAESRVLISSVPLEIPNSTARMKILFALQITKVIDVRRRDREWWVVLEPRGRQELHLPPSTA